MFLVFFVSSIASSFSFLFVHMGHLTRACAYWIDVGLLQDKLGHGEFAVGSSVISDNFWTYDPVGQQGNLFNN